MEEQALISEMAKNWLPSCTRSTHIRPRSVGLTRSLLLHVCFDRCDPRGRSSGFSLEINLRVGGCVPCVVHEAQVRSILTEEPDLLKTLTKTSCDITTSFNVQRSFHDLHVKF